MDVIWGFISGIVIAMIILCPVAWSYGMDRGRGQELCKSAHYDHWIDEHNLICKNSDGTLELKRQ